MDSKDQNKNTPETETNRQKSKQGEGNHKKLAKSVLQRSTAIIILIVIVIGAYLYLHFSVKAPGATNPQAQHKQGILPVEVVQVAPETIELHPEFLGQTEASKTVQIRARVPGFLQSRDFEEGSQVKKGALLFRIDPSQYQADLASAQATLQSAQAQLKYAQAQWERYRDLYKKHAVTLAEVENWQSQADVARASIAQSQAQITQAKLNLGYTYITAPMDGMIGRSQVYEGAYLDAAANSMLTTMWKIDPIYVNFVINQVQFLQWQKMRRDGVIKTDNGKLPVSLTLGNKSKYPRIGYLDLVNVQVNPGTSTIRVRAVIPNPKHVLKPGQYVHATLLGMRRTGTILVPQIAILQNPASAYVYVVDSKNKIEVRQVVLGDWYGSRWVIEKGLKDGDKVLVNYLNKVRPGMEVKPTVVPVQQVLDQSASQEKKEAAGESETSKAPKKDNSADNQKNQTTEKKP